jgi:hypothetical protein
VTNIIDSLVEVELPSADSFLKVKETLTRIGVASKKDNILYQSCHILHKQGKYYILHFKELFILDNKAESLSEEDRSRRNTIVNLLEEWGLVKIVNKSSVQDPTAPLSQIKVLPFKEKDEWVLVAKYAIGKKK